MSSGDMAYCPYRMGTGDRKCDQGCYDYPRCLDLGEPTEAEREECRQRMSGGRGSPSSAGGPSAMNSGRGSAQARRATSDQLIGVHWSWNEDMKLIRTRVKFRLRHGVQSLRRWPLAGQSGRFGRWRLYRGSAFCG